MCIMHVPNNNNMCYCTCPWRAMLCTEIPWIHKEGTEKICALRVSNQRKQATSSAATMASSLRRVHPAWGAQKRKWKGEHERDEYMWSSGWLFFLLHAMYFPEDRDGGIREGIMLMMIWRGRPTSQKEKFFYVFFSWIYTTKTNSTVDVLSRLCSCTVLYENVHKKPGQRRRWSLAV